MTRFIVYDNKKSKHINIDFNNWLFYQYLTISDFKLEYLLVNIVEKEITLYL